MNDCFKYFTAYNLYATIVVLLFGQRLLPEAVIDVVRGTSLLVAMSVAYIYVVYGTKAVFSMYQRINPTWSACSNMLFDWVVHFGPVLMLGLPRRSRSLVIALVLMLVWYWVVRDDVQNIYIRSIPLTGYDALIQVMSMAVALYVLSNALLQEK